MYLVIYLKFLSIYSGDTGLLHGSPGGYKGKSSQLCPVFWLRRRKYQSPNLSAGMSVPSSFQRQDLNLFKLYNGGMWEEAGVHCPMYDMIEQIINFFGIFCMWCVCGFKLYTVLWIVISQVIIYKIDARPLIRAVNHVESVILTVQILETVFTLSAETRPRAITPFAFGVEQSLRSHVLMDYLILLKGGASEVLQKVHNNDTDVSVAI